MGSGVAKAIRAKFPEAYKGYRQHYDAKGLNLGEIVWTAVKPAVFVSDDGTEATAYTTLIANMITQDFYGYDGNRYADYDAIRTAFLELNECCRHLFSFDEYAAVAMPRIGAGLGGGDWNVIEQIIEETSTNYQPVVYDWKG